MARETDPADQAIAELGHLLAAVGQGDVPEPASSSLEGSGADELAERVEALEVHVARLRTALVALGEYVKRQAQRRAESDRVWREPKHG